MYRRRLIKSVLYRNHSQTQVSI